MECTATTCPRCEGSGVMSSTNVLPCNPDGSLYRPADAEKLYPGTALGVVMPCFGCNGFRVKPKRGMQYKSRANADRGIAARTAERCYSCRGDTGTVVRVELSASCSDCSGTGALPMYGPGHRLSETWERCDNMGKAAGAKFAETVQIVVDRDASFTWGDSYLGLGSLWSCADYGRAWEGTDEAVIAKVREELSTRRIQWVKIIDADTRVMADTLVIGLSRNGYTVKAANVARQMPVLPPTYTDAVLNRPA